MRTENRKVVSDRRLLIASVRGRAIFWSGLATAALGAGGIANANSIADSNVFSGETTNATSYYNASTYPSSDAVDQSGTTNPFVFNDTNATTGNMLLSISGFNSAVQSVNIFDHPAYAGRTAPGVTIYFSPVNQTSVTPNDYAEGGTHFTLPVNGPTIVANGDYYSYVNTSTDGYTYDSIAVNAPAGTQSMLFSFDKALSGGAEFGNSSYGIGITEIQGTAPEPSAAGACLLAGLGLMARRSRRA
jgi:hypothetical protein